MRDSVKLEVAAAYEIPVNQLRAFLSCIVSQMGERDVLVLWVNVEHTHVVLI